MQKRDGVGLTRLENYYLMTNIKGALMLILVCYHLFSLRLSSSVAQIEDFSNIWILLGPVFIIGLCTVPMFVMVTGYYSKDVESCRNNAFAPH